MNGTLYMYDTVLIILFKRGEQNVFMKRLHHIDMDYSKMH